MSEPFAKGQCLCGAVRIVITAEPVRMVQCHCKDCQRATGTGHISNALFKEEHVTIVGDLVNFAVIADSGNTLTRNFCPKCGSRCANYSTGRPGLVSVPVGILDDTSWFKPVAVLYTKYRQSWDITREDIPNFEAMPT